LNHEEREGVAIPLQVHEEEQKLSSLRVLAVRVSIFVAFVVKGFLR